MCATGKTKFSRNAIIAMIVIPLSLLTGYAGIRSYQKVMNQTVPAVNDKIISEYEALVKDLDVYDKTSGVFTNDIKHQLSGLRSDLFTLAAGNPKLSNEVLDLVREHGETLQMLSPTYQAMLFCSNNRDKCKELLDTITRDLASKIN